MKTFKLHLIRHGLTQGNLDGIYMGGGLDVPLCEKGRVDLQNLVNRYRYPNVGLVFSSPMQRAVQTVEILYPDMEQALVLEDLRENIFGEFEGRKVEELMHDPDFANWLNPESDFVPKGGESGRDFNARTARGLISMLEHMARNNITEAACVTHGGVIMSMLGQRGLPQKPYTEWMTDNGCGFTVRADAAMIMRDQLVEVAEILPQGYGRG